VARDADKLLPALESGGGASESEEDDEVLPARNEVLPACDEALLASDKVLPACDVDDEVLVALETNKLLPALEAAGGALESEADDEVLSARNKALLARDEVLPVSDEVLPARDKELPACDADDQVLAAREADKLLPALEACSGPSESEADGKVLLARDEVLPAGKVANGVEVPCDNILPTGEAGEAGDNLLVAGGVFMAVPEALPGAMGRTHFRSSLSTCFRNSGMPRLFATLMTSPGMTRWCNWNFTLWGRPLRLIRRSRCSPKTSMAYPISLKAGCCAIFTSLHQAGLLISIGFEPRSAQSQPCSPSRRILNIHGSASRAQFCPQTPWTFLFSRDLSLRFDRDIFAGCLIARVYWEVDIICAIRSCFFRCRSNRMWTLLAKSIKALSTSSNRSMNHFRTSLDCAAVKSSNFFNRIC